MRSTTRYLIFLLGIAFSFSVFADPIALDRRPDLMEEVLLPEAEYQKREYIPVSGPWNLVGSVDGMRIWEAPLPVRPRSLFFHKPPVGMRVFRKQSSEEWEDSTTLAFKPRLHPRDDSWSYSAKSLQVVRRIEDGKPKAGEYSVQYPKATSRNRILLDTSLVDSKQFIARQQQIDDHTQHGLFLPTGTKVSYRLTIPDNGIFTAKGFILPPEAADPILKSDGSTLHLSLYKDASPVFETTLRITTTQQKIEVDLTQFSGQTLQFVLETKDQNRELDYVFLHDPILREKKANPRRIIWVFIDTLRADHLSMYGYKRPTTPKLDAWAKEHAGIYSQARSIAPWTLPSSRTMVTGFHPERWGTVPTIQDELSSRGWYTTFLAGNIYLSSNFEGHTDWTSHRCINWPLAEVQIDRAQQVLDEQADRDVFMMLHLMDMHLPYTEPLSYRYKFAGDAPQLIPNYEFSRSEIVRARRKLKKKHKDYIIGRYDNNLAYIDDVLTPFLENLPEDSIVAIFSDHGEEFWDHNGFEHGHTLYDEVLNVPLIVKAEGISKGHHDAPVSLLDLMPTTMRALDLDFGEPQGWALQDHSEEALRSRPQAFGRLLYGTDAWGSLKDDIKYTSRSGEEISFNLATDKREKEELVRNVSRLEKSHKALADALERETALGFRISFKHPSNNKKEATVIIQLPEGLREAWRGSDPTKRTPLTVDKTDDTVVFTWSEKSSGSREAFFVPKGDPQKIYSDLLLELMVDGKRVPFTSTNISTPPYQGERLTLGKARLDGHSAYISYMYLPIPSKEDLELDAFDDEVSEELKILGYME